MKVKLILALMAATEAVRLTPVNLVSGKAMDISENQKKLFASMQHKAGSEIQIFDMNHINDPEYRENLPDMRLAITQSEINLKKTFCKEDFAKNSTLSSSANLILSSKDVPTDIQLV